MATEIVAKLKAPQRRQQILALQTAGFTQAEIAAQLHCSVSTIKNDLQVLAPAKSLAAAQLEVLNAAIGKVISVEERAQKYAQLATKAKNEAVSLGALQRIDDLDGIVTEKERIRAKRDDQPANQPMFVLPPGANVNVTIHQQRTTISSESAGLHNTSSVPNENSATTSRHDVSSRDIATNDD